MLNPFNKTKQVLPLKVALIAGAIFFFLGAIAHLFCLSLFPFYDSGLCAPYHDYLITLAALFTGSLFVVISRDPFQYKNIIKLIVAGVIVASIFSLLVPAQIDFLALGAPLKQNSTIVEGSIGLLYALLLFVLCHKNNLL